MKKFRSLSPNRGLLARVGACALAGVLLLPASASALAPSAPQPTAERGLPAVAGTVLDECAYDFPETSRDSLFSGKNVLVLMPHEDDEVSSLGGVFEEYIAAGSTVRVVFVTNGDYDGTAQTRMDEAVDALGTIGLPEEQILFLGYGDQWKGKYKHIYHAPGDLAMTSHAGRTETYGTAGHAVYHEGTAYTRDNLKKDLGGVILDFAPDTIFCVDFDGHKDHRALSLLFEETMGELLAANTGYAPTVFKSLSYNLSWHAEPDFYAENIRSTLNPWPSPYMEEVNYYNWADRVRFPVAKAALSRLKANTSTYRMLTAYASQDAAMQSGAILSGDRVFFLRDTTSLLYTAALSASSGDASLLNDFRIVDSADITVVDCVFSGHVWTPDAADTEKSVTVTLAAPATLAEIRLYDNPSLDDNVLAATVTLSDGTVLQTGPLQENGAATSVTFGARPGITGFTLKIDESAGENAGLCELEAYTAAQDHGISFIKLMNADQDFVYDYWIDKSGAERLSLYAYPGTAAALADAYTLTLDGHESCAAAFDGDGIAVTCPPGRSCTLTITSKADPAVSDAVRISNPSSARRLLVSLLQHYEHATDLSS